MAYVHPLPHPFRPNRTQPLPPTPTPPARPVQPPAPYRTSIVRQAAYSASARPVRVTIHPGPGPNPLNRPVPILASPAPQTPAPLPAPQQGIPLPTAGRPIIPTSATTARMPTLRPPDAFHDYTGSSMGSESGHFARVKGMRS